MKCHVNGEECPLMDGISEGFKRWLPCVGCREAQENASRLTGVRLGRHERRILLAAADDYAILEAEGTERAAIEAHRRSIRKLASSGMVFTRMKDYEIGERWTRRRVYKTEVRIGYIGRIVREYYRKEIESGRPIRWERHLNKILADSRIDVAELRRSFAANLEAYRPVIEAEVKFGWKRAADLSAFDDVIATLNVVDDATSYA